MGMWIGMGIVPCSPLRSPRCVRCPRGLPGGRGEAGRKRLQGGGGTTRAWAAAGGLSHSAAGLLGLGGTPEPVPFHPCVGRDTCRWTRLL